MNLFIFILIFKTSSSFDDFGPTPWTPNLNTEILESHLEYEVLQKVKFTVSFIFKVQLNVDFRFRFEFCLISDYFDWYQQDFILKI